MLQLRCSLPCRKQEALIGNQPEVVQPGSPGLETRINIELFGSLYRLRIDLFSVDAILELFITDEYVEHVTVDQNLRACTKNPFLVNAQPAQGAAKGEIDILPTTACLANTETHNPRRRRWIAADFPAHRVIAGCAIVRQRNRIYCVGIPAGRLP